MSLPFAVSIAVLGIAQAVLVALPRARRRPAWIERLRSPWWALVPALSIVVVIGVVNFYSDSATALTYLALVAVPPLAAAALGWLVRGSRPSWALAAIPLFALAWAAKGSLAGEAAALALSGLACVALGWLLVSVVPAYWLRLGVYAMAAIDTWFVTAGLLQGPNAVLTSAAPAADLPRLQAVHFGAAQMGFGDLFIAAVVGCLLAKPADGPQSRHIGRFRSRRQLVGAGLVAGLALGFDLLFFAVDTLPATVPVAVALALVTRRSSTPAPSAVAVPLF
jgi:drug/metabolite transporter (DMT)-like permease